MAKTFNTPNLTIIKEFAEPDKYLDWLPGLYKDGIYKNLFPVDFYGVLSENTVFSQKTSRSEDFNISLSRYYLFLYCLKTNPFLFDQASKVISYDDDDYIFRPELVEFLSKIQTNQEKSKINSSLTIDLVKKYAIENDVQINTERISDFLDIANTDDYRNKVSRKLDTILYESVIKHTLYQQLKKEDNFKFIIGSAAGWSDKAINLASDEITYFIDEEGGPDNKSFPAVCVLTKKINKFTKEEILQETNKYISNIFGKDVNNDCLATIIGEPDQFENNFKMMPILKGRQGDSLYYNAVCVVYDLTKIILFPKNKQRNYYAENLAEVGLGFFTKYSIELDSIDQLLTKITNFENIITSNFDENSFPQVSYKIALPDKHAEEIHFRINIEPKEDVKNSLSKEINLDRSALSEAFNSYTNSIINLYKAKRAESIYLQQFSDEDFKIVIHFDCFFNLLGITTVPKIKKKAPTTKEFSPFKLDLFNKFDVGLQDPKNITETFYKKYPDFENYIFNFSENKICFITPIMERLLYDNLDFSSRGFLFSENITLYSVKKRDSLQLLDKLRTYTDIDQITKEDLYTNEKLTNKNTEIGFLSTNYRETKYQSVSLQTMAFYLLNSSSDIEIDLKEFGEKFHYPTLSVVPKKEAKEYNLSVSLPDIETFQDVLLVSKEVQKAFEIFKRTLAVSFQGGSALTLNNFLGTINQSVLSNVPCYGDLLLLINEFKNIKNGKELAIKLMRVLLRLPIVEMLAELLEALLNELGLFGEEGNPCKDPPAKVNLDVDDLLSSYEYLKQIYFNSLNPLVPVNGILGEIPKLTTLDSWKNFAKKFAEFLILFALQYGLQILFDYLRPQIEKYCSLNTYTDWAKNKILDSDTDLDEATFTPLLSADSFGAPAGSSGALYDIQVSIDINVLIDLSQLATRQFVYEKFAEEYSLPKNQTQYDEISTFLSNISQSVDLYELASLLKQSQTPYTTKTLIDSISLTDISFKTRFVNEENINSLFIFLSNYCDYRICYDILTDSLQKYAGSICSPQTSRRAEYETILKNVGADSNNVIRDKILDLTKQVDQLCSAQINVDIDLFKQGPKILSNALTPFMVLPFSSIINFQRKIYDYELGKGLTDKQKEFLQNGGIEVSPDVSNYFPYFIYKMKEVKLKDLGFSIETNFDDPDTTILAEGLTKIFLANSSQEFKLEKQKIKNFYSKNNIIIPDEQIENYIVYNKYLGSLKSANKLFTTFIKNQFKFDDFFLNVNYTVEYLEELKGEIQESVEESNNIDVRDTPEAFNSYIDKIISYKG